MGADPALAEILPTLTRGTAWKQTAAIPLQFETFHPQGMVKIGDVFFFSSVDIRTPTVVADIGLADDPKPSLDRADEQWNTRALYA